MGGDYVCLIHGKKYSEHDCLYCCLCFKDLKLEDCNITASGKPEDVCKECAQIEKEANVQKLDKDNESR